MSKSSQLQLYTTSRWLTLESSFTGSEHIHRVKFIAVTQKRIVEQIAGLFLSSCRPLRDFFFCPPQELILLTSMSNLLTICLDLRAHLPLAASTSDNRRSHAPFDSDSSDCIHRHARYCQGNRRLHQSPSQRVRFPVAVDAFDEPTSVI